MLKDVSDCSDCNSDDDNDDDDNCNSKKTDYYANNDNKMQL